MDTGTGRTGVIITATKAESDLLIKELGLELSNKNPFPVFKTNNLTLVISGTGKANGAMAAAFACVKYRPAWVLNPGSAGATNEFTNIGDIFQVKKVIEPDRPHFRTDTAFMQFPDTLEGFASAVLATHDRPVMDRNSLIELSPIADLVDMEGASIVQACKRFKAPCYLFKFASDSPSHGGDVFKIRNSIEKHVIHFTRFITESIIPQLSSGH